MTDFLFHNLSDFSPDLRVLAELKSYALSEIRANPDSNAKCQTEEFSSFADGRAVRTIYPQGLTVLRQIMENITPVCFVGFLGYKRKKSEINNRLVADVWQMDNDLINELKKHNQIVLYVSGERCDGDWSNLVVFRTMSAIDNWRDSELHASAVRDISPKYYYKIRIHRGKLLSGLEGDFSINQTLFLNYDADDASERRTIQKWNDA